MTAPDRDAWGLNPTRIRKTLDRIAYASLVLDVCITIITALSAFNVGSPQNLPFPISYLLATVIALSIILFVALLLFRSKERQAVSAAPTRKSHLASDIGIAIVVLILVGIFAMEAVAGTLALFYYKPNANPIFVDANGVVSPLPSGYQGSGYIRFTNTNTSPSVTCSKATNGCVTLIIQTNGAYSLLLDNDQNYLADFTYGPSGQYHCQSPLSLDATKVNYTFNMRCNS